MQSPKKPKYRKTHKSIRRLYGVETRGCEMAFGNYGLVALEPCLLSSRQIEAGRIAIVRHAKRGGKIWIRIFAQKPITKKPAEVRMGKGKGSAEYWAAEVRSGKLLYEVTGLSEEVAVGALKRVAAKLPIKCRIIKRSENLL